MAQQTKPRIFKKVVPEPPTAGSTKSLFMASRESQAMEVSGDGEFCVTGGGGQIQSWSLSGRNKIAEYQSKAGPVRLWISLSPDNSLVASGSPHAKGCFLWNPRSGEVERRFESDSFTTSLAWSADGAKIFIGGDGGEICAIEVKSGKTTKLMPAETLARDKLSLCTSRCGSFLFYRQANSVFCYELTKKKTHKLTPQFTVEAIAVSKNNQRLVAGGGMLCVWDVKTRKKAAIEKPGHTLSSLDISPENNLIATGTTLEGRIGVYAVDNLKKIAELNHGIGLWSVRFSGDRLYSLGTDGSVKVWPVASR